ncbi:MAG: viperin family antiviral radical SAM protein [Brevinema sp.]
MNINLSKLVVNWHFINACNMSCRFCFANKGLCAQKSLEEMLGLVDKLSIFKRINFVGGEPTIHPDFQKMVALANFLGTKTSVVTNGLYPMQHPELFEQCFSSMCKVGLSIDSLCPETNNFTGRVTPQQRTLSMKEAIDFCRRIKDMGVLLKINTVVHQANKDENFNDFIQLVQPDQWKIFQVLPADDSKGYEDLLINQKEFHKFLQRHEHFQKIICDENKDLITNSYIMVNADGYFMNTAPYTIQPDQRSLFEKDTDVVTEFVQMNYNLEKYNARYRKIS